MQTLSTRSTLRIATMRHQRQGPQVPVAGIAITHLSISTTDGMHIIPVDEIRRCQAESNYCTIHWGDRQKVMASKPLKAIDALLPEDGFARIHQSHIVRLTDIRLVGKECVVLSDGDCLPLSRGCRPPLLERINDFSAKL